jgi:hypothetical protein
MGKNLSKGNAAGVLVLTSSGVTRVQAMILMVTCDVPKLGARI